MITKFRDNGQVIYKYNIEFEVMSLGKKKVLGRKYYHIYLLCYYYIKVIPCHLECCY